MLSTSRIIGIALMIAGAGVVGGGAYSIRRQRAQAEEQCVNAGMNFYFQRDFPGNAEVIAGYHENETAHAYFSPDSPSHPALEPARRLGRTARNWVEAQCSQ